MRAGFRLPRAAVAEAWDSQAFAGAARDAGLLDAQKQVLIHKTFTTKTWYWCRMRCLPHATADGLADGLVLDFVACTTARVHPMLAELSCTGPKGTVCVSAGDPFRRR